MRERGVRRSGDVIVAGIGALPNWVKGWGTFGLGIASGVFVAATYLADVRNVANVADARSKEHEPRIQRLELEAATSQEAARSIKEQMTEMRADVKELLRRVK